MDTLITLGILLVLFVIIYSKLKNKTLRESLEEFKEVVTGGKKNE